ncbi:GntR family transcriptional regulator [Litoreibacter ponti]|uniref:GntR family transcriptional regulator n=1 Tax=Litoreibacter ponti TaxID=1510457 RepID=A0A2T6BJS2_9RHOB|nr:GntR family transcriptional regulator [Litoreibacter ponti]PTX56304.1 GntR family transcriptional regulator [Litoreibacter ponti]
MAYVADIQERRTSADVVFDYLYEQISSLELMPGTKISEAEIASKFGVSRQPVRDAFSRLDNLDLLLIRPQKATVVKKFSLTSIATARFARLAIELEVMHRAVDAWDGMLLAEFEASLDAQGQAVASRDVEGFHALDYDFHRLLCRAAKCEFAFELISENKAQVDRLCVLSLTGADSMGVLVEDHKAMLAHLKARDTAALCAATRLHLSRLDSTVETIYKDHASYFSD